MSIVSNNLVNLTKLNLSTTVLVNFKQQVLQLLGQCNGEGGDDDDDDLDDDIHDHDDNQDNADVVPEYLLSWSEAHGPHDLPKVVGGQELHLLGVEQVETHLHFISHYPPLHFLRNYFHNFIIIIILTIWTSP